MKHKSRRSVSLGSDAWFLPSYQRSGLVAVDLSLDLLIARDYLLDLRTGTSLLQNPNLPHGRLLEEDGSFVGDLLRVITF